MYKISWDNTGIDPRFPAHMSGGSRTNIKYIVERNGVPNKIVELGCFEGSTTFWMSDTYTMYNPNLQIYAIDPHEGSVEIEESPELLHNNFTYNLSICKQKNVEYIRKKSEDGLIDLINRGIEVEFIYIDGDHRAPTVLTDLVLSWKLLKVGGIILCDDTGDWVYEDKNKTRAAQMSPRIAVENFIQCYWDRLNPMAIPNMSQTAFRKIC